MLRQLREDARDFPATMILGALWVVVFLAMLASQWSLTRRMSTGEFLLGLRVGHRFGDMTLQELFAGEIWRTVTATFVALPPTVSAWLSVLPGARRFSCHTRSVPAPETP